MKKLDVIVIGFGKAGKTIAAEMAANGRHVAIIERSAQMYGGTCINIGCIPTKALVHKAALTPATADFATRQTYYAAAIAAKEHLTGALRNTNYHKLADNPLIEVYTGEGRFVAPKVVAVKQATATIELTAPTIIINTGAETVIPPIKGIEHNPHVYTSTSILELSELPQRLTIVGGGYIGLEFASMYAAFGSRVTVLEGFSELISREDRDVANAVRQTLEEQGVVFRLNAHVEEIDGGTVHVTDAQTQAHFAVESDAVLLATGRRPAVNGLGLDAAGVALTEHGAIRVDEHLRTNVEGIYAAGDVTGGLQFTYVSLDDYRILRDELLGNGARTTANRGVVPYAVFITPPLAHVGLHETEARKAGLDVRVNRIALKNVPRAHTLEQTNGFFKAIIENGSDRIIGSTLYGTESSELINTITLAINQQIPAHTLRQAIYTHPSMSEVFNDLFA